jgi:hypothetical protein
VSADGKTITLNPEVGLLPNTGYSVTYGILGDGVGNYLG